MTTAESVHDTQRPLASTLQPTTDASPPDTLIAAIALHRVARADLEAKLGVLSKLEAELPKAKRLSEMNGAGEDGDEPKVIATDDPRWSAQIVACAEAHDVEEELFRSLFDIPPASLAEGAALLRHFFEIMETEEVFTRVFDDSVQTVFLRIADLMAPRTGRGASMSAEPFKAVCNLEYPISKISDFAFALLLMSSEIPDDTGLAVHRLATEIRGQAKLLGDLHGKLFHALHPGPAALLETEGAA